MNNSVNISKIPEDATHVWTPAVSLPIIGFSFRRAYYKKVKGIWYSYTVYGDWRPTGNTPEWFKKETQLGYFITVKKFTKPGFVPLKESNHV